MCFRDFIALSILKAPFAFTAILTVDFLFFEIKFLREIFTNVPVASTVERNLNETKSGN